MHLRTESALENRLIEALLRDLFPCDLGDGVEVVHDVEMVEIEMDCELGDDYSTPYERIEIHFAPTSALPFAEVSRERVPILGALNAFERSPVLDTLPFAPFDPSDVREDAVPIARKKIATGSGRIERVSSAAALLAETVPYARSDADDDNTTPFVKR